MARATHIITGLGAAALLLAPLTAQERAGDQDPTRTRGVTQGTQDRVHTQDQERMGAAAHGPLVKASDLIGKDIKNREGTDMGDVNELAIDLHSGRVAYAVVSFGGFLGIGDKLVAVPFRALKPGPKGDYLMLDVPKEKLEKAPNFDKDKWPDMDDDEWGRTVHGFYGVDPYWSEGGRGPIGRVGGDTRIGDRDLDRNRGRLGGEIADASFLVQKFNPATMTTVTGRVVNVERPLAGGREGTNYGPTGGVETGRTGAGADRPADRTGVADRERMGDDHKTKLGSDAMKAGGAPVCITLRTETAVGGAGDTGRVGETGRTGEPGRTGETGRTGQIGGVGAAGSQTVKVYLAPSQFLETQNLNLDQNDQLTVTGSRVDVHGDTAIIATQVRKADQVVKLRSDNGAPVWGDAASPPAGGRR